MLPAVKPLQRIGRYEILLRIARGGMATVYLARAEGLGGFDRYVALKRTAEHLRDDPEFASHLIEEAKLVAHLRHTNVVPVFDVGEDDVGAVFLVMEYVAGDSLGGLARKARKANTALPWRVGMRVLVDALAGLHAAHEHADEDGNSHRLVHRDFSPQNILVGSDGVARLTDFGIAKAASRASVTVAGTMKGKVSYASPEQASGKKLDRRCDIWAAGVVAWEIFAGRKLYAPGADTLLDVISGPPPRLREVVPDVPAEIDEVIASALQMAVEDRPPTAQAFARALSSAARNGGYLCEVDEVAEYVEHAMGPILAKRKALIAEARRIRDADPTIAEPFFMPEDFPESSRSLGSDRSLIHTPASTPRATIPDSATPTEAIPTASPPSGRHSASPEAPDVPRDSSIRRSAKVIVLEHPLLARTKRILTERRGLSIGVLVVALFAGVFLFVGRSKDSSTAARPDASALAPSAAASAAPTVAEADLPPTPPTASATPSVARPAGRPATKPAGARPGAIAPKRR